MKTLILTVALFLSSISIANAITGNSYLELTEEQIVYYGMGVLDMYSEPLCIPENVPLGS
jgi:hypothetical protein